MYSDYYLIPIFDSFLKIKDCDNSFISLAEYTKKYLPKLYKLEDERIGTIWSGNASAPLTIQQKNMITSIENKMKKLADKINIPLFLLVVMDKNGKVYEIATKQEIYYAYGYMLSVRKCSKSVFMEKYYSTYVSCIKNFFNRKNFKLIEFPIQKVLKR